MMMSEDDAQKAIDYIRDSAPVYAKAKAERTYIENYLKVVKATEMANSDKKTLGDREIDAYMSMTYETQLKAIVRQWLQKRNSSTVWRLPSLGLNTIKLPASTTE
jgi:hypothetical protein